MKTCVVVPTYNERANVAALLERLGKVRMADLDVLFVDDSSPDGTAEEIRAAMAANPSVHLLLRTEKKGIGSAHIAGFAWALKELAPGVLIEMDSDLQHPPELIPQLASAVAAADVAVASRKVPGGATEGWSLWRRWVSSGANLLTRVVLGIPVKDSTSGFRALSARAAADVVDHPPRAGDYFFQVESLYTLKRRGAKMVEVPFVFRSRVSGRSKMGAREIAGFFFGVWRLRLFGS